jgi:cytochrome c
MRAYLAGFLSIICILDVSPVAAQTSPDFQRGLSLVKTHCAQCHSINKVGSSPSSIAPPFRDLHKRYPVENLAEAFAEGILTGHPSMPQFRFEPDQIENLIALLKSLE